MRNKTLIGHILFLLFIAIISCRAKLNGRHFGLIFSDGKVLYWQPGYVPSGKFFKDVLRNQTVKDGLLLLSNQTIWMFDMGSDRVSAGEGQRFFYRIKDERAEISKDKKEWYKLDIRTTAVNDGLTSDKIPILARLEIVCPFFRGEYQVLDIPEEKPDHH